VVLEAVRLDHESQFLVSEVGDREESWLGHNELRGEVKAGGECECPKYGLERAFRGAEVGPPDLDTLHRNPYVTFPWNGHPHLER
jgi:hypothetical protein